MNQLYPVIRRVRRPLVVAESEPKASPKPAAGVEDVVPAEPPTTEREKGSRKSASVEEGHE